MINQYGGKMKETYGVPVEEIQEAIKHGVRKINIDTDIRLAMTGAVRKFLAENPDKFDARDWLKPAREAAYKVCKQRYLQFGCEGQAAKIKPMSLARGGRRLPQRPARADGGLSPPARRITSSCRRTSAPVASRRPGGACSGRPARPRR